TLQASESLQLNAGVAVDHLEYPQNNEIPPVASSDHQKDQVSPKAGFRWTPTANTAFRGVWTRSLGGVFNDASIRLEPSQIAGFNQAFRSIIPESLGGLIPGAEFESFGLAYDQKLATRTYFSIAGEVLNSTGKRTSGVIDAAGPFSNTAGSVEESL